MTAHSSGSACSAGKAVDTDGLQTPRRYWAALALLLAIAVVVLDASMANVALPSIARSLSIDAGQVVWVAMSYNLAVVVSLLPLSAVAERIGFKRMYVVGMLVFMLASIAAALSTSLTSLVAARIGQAVASSMLMGMFGGLVRNIYPINKLAAGISVNAMVVGLMSVLGPSIGAFILEIAAWPWIFWVVVPFCVGSLALVRFLPDVPRLAARFDGLACVLSMIVFGLSILGLDLIVKKPLTAVLCLMVVAGTGWILLRRSRTQTTPLVPVDLLRIVNIRFAVGASFFSFSAQMSAFVALPFYFQSVFNHSYSQVGFLLGAWAIGVGAMAPVAGFMSGRFPVAIMCGLGAAGMALGMGTVLALPVTVPFGWLLAAMLLGGVGFGFFQTPNNRALLSGAPRKRSGAAGGLQAITRVLGQGFGTALVSVAFNLSSASGPAAAVGVSIVCALTALAINVRRHLNPAPDADL
jgi:DHA2 family multidrug resistance protein-like MFS transporter